jgi:uncharacterized protein (TIGR00290 family)
MWSGGKDIALAVVRARAAGLIVDRFLSFYDPATGRLRFHETPVALLATQAEAAEAELDARAASWSELGTAFRGALAELRAAGYAGLVFGDIHLADVRAWYEDQVREAGLEQVEPIWGEAPIELVDEYVSRGGLAVVTCVDATRLGRDWLGRVTDAAFIRDIAYEPVDAAGENGEYHTFAFGGPPFTSPVLWSVGSRADDGRFDRLLLERG